MKHTDEFIGVCLFCHAHLHVLCAVEFAWHGCPTIGSMVGGLGKVPGIYFRNLESGDNTHVLRQLQDAIGLAMEMDAQTLISMSHASLEVTFPVDKWSAALDEQYLNALAYEGKMKPRVPRARAGSISNTEDDDPPDADVARADEELGSDLEILPALRPSLSASRSVLASSSSLGETTAAVYAELDSHRPESFRCVSPGASSRALGDRVVHEASGTDGDEEAQHAALDRLQPKSFRCVSPGASSRALGGRVVHEASGTGGDEEAQYAALDRLKPKSFRCVSPGVSSEALGGSADDGGTGELVPITEVGCPGEDTREVSSSCNDEDGGRRPDGGAEGAAMGPSQGKDSKIQRPEGGALLSIDVGPSEVSSPSDILHPSTTEKRVRFDAARQQQPPTLKLARSKSSPRSNATPSSGSTAHSDIWGLSRRDSARSPISHRSSAYEGSEEVSHRTLSQTPSHRRKSKFASHPSVRAVTRRRSGSLLTRGGSISGGGSEDSSTPRQPPIPIGRRSAGRNSQLEWLSAMEQAFDRAGPSPFEGIPARRSIGLASGRSASYRSPSGTCVSSDSLHSVCSRSSTRSQVGAQPPGPVAGHAQPSDEQHGNGVMVDTSDHASDQPACPPAEGQRKRWRLKFKDPQTGTVAARDSRARSGQAPGSLLPPLIPRVVRDSIAEKADMLSTFARTTFCPPETEAPGKLERMVSELQPTMNAAKVEEAVMQSTVHNFLLDNDMPMGDIITAAYVKARLTRGNTSRDYVAELVLFLVPCWSRERKLGLLNDFMRYEFFGCAMMGWIVNLLGVLVPVGSLAIMAFALYGTAGWSTHEVMALFSVHSATTAIGALGWMHLARRYQTTHLLALAPLLQCSMMALVYGGVISKPAFFCCTAFHGFAAGAVEPLYIGFNYLDKWAGDSRTAAWRMSLVEPWRFLLQFAVVGLLAFGVNNEDAIASQLPPVSIQVIFATITAFTFMLGLLALYIPIEQTLRLPPVSLTLELFPSWCWLVAGDAIAKLSGFLDVIYLTWMFVAGYSETQVGVFFFCLGGAGALVAFGFCALLFTVHGYGKFITVAIAMCTFPPSFLGALVAFSAPRLSPAVVPFILGITVILTTLKRMAAALLKVFSMPSRWKYVTFQSYGACFLSACEAVSPWLMLAFSSALDLDISVSGPVYSDVLARSTFVLSCAFSLVHFAVSLGAIRHLIAEGVLPWFPPTPPLPPWPPSAEAPAEAPPLSTPNVRAVSDERGSKFVMDVDEDQTRPPPPPRMDSPFEPLASLTSFARSALRRAVSACVGTSSSLHAPPPPPATGTKQSRRKHSLIVVENSARSKSGRESSRDSNRSGIRKVFEYVFRPGVPGTDLSRRTSSASSLGRSVSILIPRWLRSESNDSRETSSGRSDSNRSGTRPRLGRSDTARTDDSEPGWLRDAGRRLGMFKPPPTRGEANNTLATLAEQAGKGIHPANEVAITVQSASTE